MAAVSQEKSTMSKRHQWCRITKFTYRLVAASLKVYTQVDCHFDFYPCSMAAWEKSAML